MGRTCQERKKKNSEARRRRSIRRRKERAEKTRIACSGRKKVGEVEKEKNLWLILFIQHGRPFHPIINNSAALDACLPFLLL